MLHSLSVRGVGPARALDVRPAPRLNLFTGDNGLGKSFLLDLAWWTLAGTWPEGVPATPTPSLTAGVRNVREARILWTSDTRQGAPSEQEEARFDPEAEGLWRRQQRESGDEPPKPGLVLYARIDGGFSVWDPARNYWRQLGARGFAHPERPDAYHFDRQQVWDGMTLGDTRVSEGLIRDWVSWQRKHAAGEVDGVDPFALLTAALSRLSADQRELLQPGRITRVVGGGARDYPTLRFPYGEVPVHIASSAMRRISALAYLIVWTWYEHVRACKVLGDEPERRFMILWDEVETHLHPRWQRLVLPALLEVIQGLNEGMRVQLWATTHAPLVLASVEPSFDPGLDALHLLKLDGQEVSIQRTRWVARGDALNWLLSDIFGLQQARSVRAEVAIEAAEAWMRGDVAALPDHLRTPDAIHDELRALLPGMDPFWPRWIVHRGRGTS
ncbi:MAG: ATP-binding protein [Alphaproteobacteria bacterium]|nr:ATP-binding protein [Alphaproteobacteria bacterium]